MVILTEMPGTLSSQLPSFRVGSPARQQYPSNRPDGGHRGLHSEGWPPKG